MRERSRSASYPSGASRRIAATRATDRSVIERGIFSTPARQVAELTDLAASAAHPPSHGGARPTRQRVTALRHKPDEDSSERVARVGRRKVHVPGAVLQTRGAVGDERPDTVPSHEGTQIVTVPPDAQRACERAGIEPAFRPHAAIRALENESREIRQPPDRGPDQHGISGGARGNGLGARARCEVALAGLRDAAHEGLDPVERDAARQDLRARHASTVEKAVAQ